MAQITSDIPEIEALEQRRAEAMKAGDLRALDELLDDALVYIHSTALVDDKAAYLKLMRDGTLVYHSIDPASVKTTAVNDDLVLLSGRMKMDILWAGKAKALDNVFICSWVRRASGWKFLTWQSTAVPTAS